MLSTSNSSELGANKAAPQLGASGKDCVLLDIKQDRLLKLNPVSADVWKLLCNGETESQIVQKIAQKYQVGAQRVANDVRVFLAQIEDLQLSPTTSILSSAPLEDRDLRSAPSFPWYGNTTGGEERSSSAVMATLAFVGLAVFDLILSVFSFQVLCSFVRAWPLCKTVIPTSDNAEQACRSVQRACVWYPKQALCLQRSAVTTCLLRSRGVAAEMVIGVRAMPFMAHAWVEVQGAVVNDWPGVQTFYGKLPIAFKG